MRNSILVTVCLLVAPVCLLDATEAVVPRRAVVITLAGRPDTNLVDKVASYVGENCGCAVRVRQARAGGLSSTPEAEAAELQKTLGSNDVFLVELLNVPEDTKFRSYVFSGRHVALLNVWSLRLSGDSSGPSRRILYEARVMKETMCLLGRMLGLDVCPNPRCALSNWESEEQLDKKGGNFCPPCKNKAQEFLSQAGVTLIP